MHKFQKAKLEKWESNMRQKMGDIRFLQKYIPLYKIFDKILKTVILVGVCFLFLATLWRIVLLIMSFTLGNFMFAVFSLILLLSWILINVFYSPS
jgi:hypothetical protein